MRYLRQREAAFWWPDCCPFRSKPWRSCTFRFVWAPGPCRLTDLSPKRRSLLSGWTSSKKCRPLSHAGFSHAVFLERTARSDRKLKRPIILVIGEALQESFTSVANEIPFLFSRFSEFRKRAFHQHSKEGSAQHSESHWFRRKLFSVAANWNFKATMILIVLSRFSFTQDSDE